MLIRDLSRAVAQALRYAWLAYRDRHWADLLKQLLRWPALAALRPVQSLAWFARWQHADLQGLLQHSPLLPLKPLRPYVSLRWDRSRRMRVIAQSYELLLCGAQPVRDAVLRRGGSVLARAGLKSGEQIELHIGTHFRFRKEGEVVLSLRAGAERDVVASVALAFEKVTDAGWRAYIGCLQGVPEARADHYRLTKAAHGLRPNAFLVFAVQEFVRALGVDELHAVSEEIHVHRSKHFLHLPFAHRLNLAYSQLWSEAGAERVDGGWFALPLRTKRRSHDEQPSNKRAMYARRYGLMDEVAQQIRAALSPLPAWSALPWMRVPALTLQR